MRHRLRIAMEHAELKPSDLAVTLDVHRNTIGHYLSGKTHPTRAVLMAWGMRTGVSWRWILDGTEPDDGPDGLADTGQYRPLAPVTLLDRREPIAA